MCLEGQCTYKYLKRTQRSHPAPSPSILAPFIFSFLHPCPDKVSQNQQKKTGEGETSTKHHSNSPSWIIQRVFPSRRKLWDQAAVWKRSAATNTCEAFSSAGQEPCLIMGLGQWNLMGTQGCYSALHKLFKGCSNLQPVCHPEKYIYIFK